jgi:hypothetical protein
MKKRWYWEKCGALFLVYNWSRRYNRYINTHAYTNQRDAELTVR